jgi:hypothetical protein
MKDGHIFTVLILITYAGQCEYDGDEGDSCRSCLSLKIACTHKRPRKRRGPRNQYSYDSGHPYHD